MRNFLLFRWFRNVSISRKLYFTIGVMALLIGFELFALFFSIHTLSSVRAYVEGESLWSKAQKDACYHLLKYGIEWDEKDYAQFQSFMKIPIGDSKARKELLKQNPDWEVARKGFLEGRNHPEDIEGMIKLFRRFHSISYIDKAIYYWGEAEPIAFSLMAIADSLHNEINSEKPSELKINDLLQSVTSKAEKITLSEDNFSYTLADGSRWLEDLILKLLFIIALTVEISGLLLAISVSRSIQKGLSEIIYAADSFARGNLHTRATVFSSDEIGVLAGTFNRMSDKLETNIKTLEAAQKKFKGLLESAPDAMIIMDQKGVIKLVNEQAETLFGYKREALVSNRIDILINDTEKDLSTASRKYWRELLLGQNMTLDFSGRRQNGTEFPAEITLSPLQTEEGMLISAAIRDISERKYLKELESKNKELEQFAYIASHDLQEPLNTITSFASLLEEEQKDKLDAEAKTYLGYIKESSDRMTELITGILEYSRIGGKSSPEITDCNKILQEVLNDMKATLTEARAKIVFGDLPSLKAMPVELRVLFQNLISNAVKFRNKNTVPEINISAVREENYWHFTVKDNGIGIEEKYNEKIFIIFQRLNNTRSYSGTGIGLAHCKKIVELHQGKIWVESEPGKGSTFHFT
ncbi:MAG: sensor histidine kinase, partial [Bacteroidia bacterium]